MFSPSQVAFEDVRAGELRSQRFERLNSAPREEQARAAMMQRSSDSPAQAPGRPREHHPRTDDLHPSVGHGSILLSSGRPCTSAAPGGRLKLSDDGRLQVMYEQTCPRCGRDLVGENKNEVADAVVEHARIEHRHPLDRDIVLAHLDGVHPQERD